jgi:hypothetical protein
MGKLQNFFGSLHGRALTCEDQVLVPTPENPKP